MKKFQKLEDCNINEPIERYIYEKIKYMSNEYQVDDISDFGAIYLINNNLDLKRFLEMEFVKPIKNYFSEYEKIINIDDTRKNVYLERCFIYSDGYGVIIIEKTNWKEVYYNGNKMEIYMEFFVCFFILIII